MSTDTDLIAACKDVNLDKRAKVIASKPLSSRGIAAIKAALMSNDPDERAAARAVWGAIKSNLNN
jgi:hypothetical protein